MLPLNILSESDAHLFPDGPPLRQRHERRVRHRARRGAAGLFVPIPLMALEILVGLVQAYIFTVLATVFIGAAIGDAAKA